MPTYHVAIVSHQVIPFAHGISAKLAARSRHVCVFFGAGAGRACGLPDIAGLEAQVLKGLEGEGHQAAFKAQLAGRNLEEALSRLRRIAFLLEDSKNEVDGLTADKARELDREVCRLIVAALDVATADVKPMLEFAAWAAQADYHLPVEIFTVNYDLLLETALEALGVPYFDGFVGTLRARFRADLVEAAPSEPEEWLPAFLVRLWKLHGSVHWAWETDARADVVRLGAAAANNEPAAIYPSDTKYDESQRVPFVVLQDRLRRALNQRETLMLVSGYSFGDAHLNEMLFNAACRRPRSELVIFCFDSIPDELAERAAVTPNLQVAGPREAILGGVRADWEAPKDPSPGLWTEDGFALSDFSKLATFLARSSPPQGELEARLDDLLAKVAADGGG